MCAEPACAADCFPPQSRICDRWRCRWAGAPSLDGILGDREGWLGGSQKERVATGLGPLPGLGLCRAWAASFRCSFRTLRVAAHGSLAPALGFLHRHTQLRAGETWLARALSGSLGVTWGRWGSLGFSV